MVPLYRTSHMEKAVNLLASRFPSVIARAVYATERPIRLRANLLEPADRIRFAKYNDPHSKQVSGWKKSGGILVNHIIDAPEIAHDAQFFVEAPASLELLDDLTRHTRTLACVYKPPNWNAHEAFIFQRFPASDACRRFVSAIEASTLSRDHESLCRLLQIPSAGLVGISHNALAEKIGIQYRDIKWMHRKVLAGTRAGYFEIQPLLPRIEPEAPALLQLYTYIKDELPNVAGVRYAVNNVLSKAVKMWRIPLRALVRDGCVEKGEKIGFYVRDQVRPDFDWIEAEHQNARSKLFRVIKAVEDAPDYLRSRAAKSLSPSSVSP